MAEGMEVKKKGQYTHLSKEPCWEGTCDGGYFGGSYYLYGCKLIETAQKRRE